MKRKIISINQDLCNGCGVCIPNCPEGALQIIDWKARLISDLFCDGLGACVGECPLDAISVIERDAEKYDEAKVMYNIIQQGDNTIKAHLKHLKEHNEIEFLKQAIDYLNGEGLNEYNYMLESDKPKLSHHSGCPGSAIYDFSDNKEEERETIQDISSELRQWPIQLMLISPHAPYFKDCNLIVTADCVPFSYANFHQKYLKNNKLIMFCPKLDDDLELYADKLTELFTVNDIKSVKVIHMEVPCCFGVGSIVKEAINRSGKNIPINDITITLKGEEKTNANN